MAFGTGPNNNPRGSEDSTSRPDSQNNPADNPNKKDRVQGEDDALTDQKVFESEPQNEKEKVETPDSNSRTADEVSLDEWAVGGYCL
jgi:hypothetical protein